MQVWMHLKHLRIGLQQHVMRQIGYKHFIFCYEFQRLSTLKTVLQFARDSIHFNFKEYLNVYLIP